ncbi:hypothetical protein BpHYR1_010047 [Brachionus plicatilis]|uniref:Uncharacterized protein n=1 Tax=Brachionus plicatilis TaxID=10195 RepID=A0A3M7R9U6_BRAPC|nr:hypothetical protein BpHYR1_010047 [Brachionus plicatilis]
MTICQCGQNKKILDLHKINFETRYSNFCADPKFCASRLKKKILHVLNRPVTFRLISLNEHVKNNRNILPYEPKKY